MIAPTNHSGTFADVKVQKKRPAGLRLGLADRQTESVTGLVGDQSHAVRFATASPNSARQTLDDLTANEIEFADSFEQSEHDVAHELDQYIGTIVAFEGERAQIVLEGLDGSRFAGSSDASEFHRLKLSVGDGFLCTTIGTPRGVEVKIEPLAPVEPDVEAIKELEARLAKITDEGRQ